MGWNLSNTQQRIYGFLHLSALLLRFKKCLFKNTYSLFLPEKFQFSEEAVFSLPNWGGVTLFIITVFPGAHNQAEAGLDSFPLTSSLAPWPRKKGLPLSINSNRIRCIRWENWKEKMRQNQLGIAGAPRSFQCNSQCFTIYSKSICQIPQ